MQEFFQVRAASGCPQLWPHTACPHLQPCALRAFALLSDIAAILTRQVLGAVGLSDAYASTLLTDELRHIHSDADAAVGSGDKRPALPAEVSCSNFMAFRYSHPPGKPDHVHCPYHSDVAMMTLIPCARGAPGLHAFDWKLGKWIALEDGADADVAAIFGGETLSRLTGGFILPCMHEVAHVSSTRLSMVLQLCADGKATLNEQSEALDQKVVGDVCAATYARTSPCIAQQFVLADSDSVVIDQARLDTQQ